MSSHILLKIEVCESFSGGNREERTQLSIRVDVSLADRVLEVIGFNVISNKEDQQMQAFYMLENWKEKVTKDNSN